MGTKHIHAEVIKAWADGEEIEYKTCQGFWELLDSPAPTWTYREYRVKPKEPVTVSVSVYPVMECYDKPKTPTQICVFHSHVLKNVKFSFDPDTLKLIKVELIND